MANKVVGGKRITIALHALEQKITRAGTLRVGFLEGARYTDTHPVRGTKRKPLSVAQVAFWNEYGTSRTPSRPFFRTAIARESKNWGTKLAAAVKFHNYDGEAALRTLGQSMRDDIEASIAQWSTPGNAARTIARKGFDKPLVDEGTMQRAPDFEIVK